MGIRGRGIGFAIGLVLLCLSAPAAGQRAEKAKEVLGLLDARLVQVELPAPGEEPGFVAIRGADRQDVLVLRSQAWHSPNYEVLIQRADGSFSVSSGSRPESFRGTLESFPGSEVAATRSEFGLFARITMPDGRNFWLEPLGARVDGAAPSEYVIYEDDDVLETAELCAALAAPAGIGDIGGTGETAPTTGEATTIMVAEMACDADYEYYASYGSVSAVEARIHAVIDAVNLQYESQVGIRHEVTTIVVRTSALAQPYTATASSDLLVQFRDEWNANHTSVLRDVAHLFTGKELDGSTIGVAYIGVICNSTYGYGLSQSDFSTSFASVTDLTAHELGHNWNAGHCTCTSNTMNAYITSANSFSSASISTITAFRDSRSCLDADTGTPPPPADPEILLADGEWTDAGAITQGSLSSTYAQDGVSEVLAETASGGRRTSRRSWMTHTWTFTVPMANSYAFFLDAHHSTNGEGDDFRFSYSRDGLSFHPMLTVTRTVANGTLSSFAFPEDVSGLLYVRVEDTDRTAGNGTRDSLTVDHMYVHAELDGVDTTPPATPTGLTGLGGDGSASLDWADSPESDLAGYLLYRSTSESGPFAAVHESLLLASDFVDLAVTNGSSYFYAVSATDLDGNESPLTAPVRVTPTEPGSATTTRISAILVGTVAAGSGSKYGRADVWIADENGLPVADALVLGTFSEGINETLAVVTDAQGLAVFVTTTSKKGKLPLTFCVDDVDHATLNYAPAQNTETCDVR